MRPGEPAPQPPGASAPGRAAWRDPLARRVEDVATGRPLDPHRLVDVTLAGCLLCLALPLVVLLALAIRLDSPGPVLYRQTRIGRRGRPFELLKLRSMRADADPGVHRAHVRRLLGRAGRGRPWAAPAADPRVTRIGRALRRTGLDELPQLINVLRGEMSLVGPRPAMPYEAALWQEWHRRRLTVRPGITGLWQVDGRGRSDFDEMVRLDLAYIERRSLRLDLAILARTPAAVWRRRAAA